MLAGKSTVPVIAKKGGGKVPLAHKQENKRDGQGPWWDARPECRVGGGPIQEGDKRATQTSTLAHKENRRKIEDYRVNKSEKMSLWTEGKEGGRALQTKGVGGCQGKGLDGCTEWSYKE